MINIRTTNDHRLLAVLNQEVQELHAQMHPQLFKAFDAEAVMQFFKTLLENKQVYAYVAYVDEMPAGFMLLIEKTLSENAFKYADRLLHIDQVGVQARYRQQGIGKLLLEKACELARALNIQRIELDHWSSNTVAKSTFEKLGFQTFREHKWLRLS